jgi:putative endonuclease
MSNLQQIGATGEQLVVDHLIQSGLIIIERNWRIRGGEIDIVARDQGVLVFVEVKTRTSSRYGHPLEAIDNKKAHRLQRLALGWIAMHDSWGSDYRIDCAAVFLRSGMNAEIDYRKGVL